MDYSDLPGPVVPAGKIRMAAAAHRFAEPSGCHQEVTRRRGKGETGTGEAAARIRKNTSTGSSGRGIDPGKNSCRFRTSPGGSPDEGERRSGYHRPQRAAADSAANQTSAATNTA